MKNLANNDSHGFTFAEMIVTVAILGTLASIAIPKFTELTFQSKIRKSEAALINIQQAFFNHYFNSSFAGAAEFPPDPSDSLMTLEWSLLPLLFNSATPASLFRNGRVPLNPNKKPYFYHLLRPVPELGLSPGFKLRDPDYLLESSYRL